MIKRQWIARCRPPDIGVICDLFANGPHAARAENSKVKIAIPQCLGPVLQG
jgi:hypothetical protein